MSEAHFDLLREMPIFGGLSDAALKLILEDAKVVDVAAGERNTEKTLSCLLSVHLCVPVAIDRRVFNARRKDAKTAVQRQSAILLMKAREESHGRAPLISTKPTDD